MHANSLQLSGHISTGKARRQPRAELRHLLPVPLALPMSRLALFLLSLASDKRFFKVFLCHFCGCDQNKVKQQQRQQQQQWQPHDNNNKSYKNNFIVATSSINQNCVLINSRHNNNSCSNNDEKKNNNNNNNNNISG